MTPVTFGRNVQGIRLALRKPLEEFPQNSVIVARRLSISRAIIVFGVGKGKAHPGGLFNIQNIGEFVPRKGIGGERSILTNIVRPVLGPQAHKATASRASVGPQDDGIFRGIALRFDVPIKNVAAVVGIHGQIASKLLKAGIVVEAGQVVNVVVSGGFGVGPQVNGQFLGFRLSSVVMCFIGIMTMLQKVGSSEDFWRCCYSGC